MSRPPSSGRRWAFRLAALILAALLLLLVEGAARLLPEPADPMVDLSSFTLFRRLEVAGEPALEISHPYAYPERRVRFPVRKPAGGFRVFVVGASAAAGWPHPPEETAAAYLRRSLAAAAPGRPVEVINAAAHGFPSYRVRRVFEEVAALDADAVVVWTGNNEFLEGRSYATRRASGLGEALAARSRAAALLRDLLLRPRTRLEGDELNDLAATFWKKVQRQALELRRDPEQLAAVERHFEQSVRAMARRSDELGVRVVLATVPVNLADWSPTVSVHGSEGEARERWSQAYASGRRLFLANDPTAATTAFAEAARLDPLHAETRYRLGLALAAVGRPEEARRELEAARDLDHNPFRALGSFNRAVRRVAAEEGAALVDLEETFARVAAARGRAAPGFDLFLDYVHPSVRGNLVAARAFYETLAAGVAEEAPRFGSLRRQLASGYSEDDDAALQLKIFGMCMVNHQHEAALARARRVAALVAAPPASPSVAPPPAEVPPAVAAALAVLPRWLRVERARWSGAPPEEGEAARAEAALAELYARWFGYGSF